MTTDGIEPSRASLGNSPPQSSGAVASLIIHYLSAVSSENIRDFVSGGGVRGYVVARRRPKCLQHKGLGVASICLPYITSREAITFDA